MVFAALVAPCVFQIWNTHGANGFIFWGCRPLLVAAWLHVGRPCLAGMEPARRCPSLPPSCFMLPPCLAAWRAAPSLPVVARPPASCWPPCLAAWRAAPSLWLHAGLPPCQSKRNNYLYRRNQKREKNANSQNSSCLSRV